MRTLLAGLALCAASGFSQGIITTVAGTDITYPGSSFSANSASFGLLSGVAVHPITGDIYFASSSRSMIFKFDPAKNSVTIVAGIGIGGYSGDGGPAVNAALNLPQQMAFDSLGNLYIADRANGAVRRIDTRGVIATALSNVGGPTGIALAADGTFFVNDSCRIVHVDTSGARSIAAGTSSCGYSGNGGPAVNAKLNSPGSFGLDSSGNLLFIDGSVVRRIATDGTISTIAGNGQSGGAVPGPATATPLEFLLGLAIDKSGNVFIGNADGQLLMIDSKGVLSNVNLYKSTISVAAYVAPRQLAFDSTGNLYFTDGPGNVLYRFSPAGALQELAGFAPSFGIGDNGPALAAGLNAPQGLGFLPDGSLLITDFGNARIRRLSPSGAITTIAGTGIPKGSTGPGPAKSLDLLPSWQAISDAAGNVYLASYQLLRIDPTGTLSVFNAIGPKTLAFDTQGNLYGAGVPREHVVYKYTPEGKSSVFAGNGQQGYSGNGGPATSASLSFPYGVAVCPDGNLYIGEPGDIRRVGLNGIITTFASGLYPGALACDQQGNLYFTDGIGVRKITTDGIIHTIAGTGQPGFGGDGGPATSALLNSPQGIAVDNAGNVYISDTNNNRIRKILATSTALSVSNDQLTISGISQGPPAQANVSVSSSVQGFQYSISFSTASGGNWLGFASLQGTAPGVLTISADPSALQPGTYQGTVTLSSPYSAPNSLTIAVTFNVAATQPAALSLQTKALSFAFTSGSGPASQQLSVSNQGAGIISFTALPSNADGGGWLSVSPLSGAVSSTTPAYLTVTVTPGALSAGTYSGSIAIASADTGESFTVPVTMSISAAQQKILLSQTGLTFIAVAKAGPPLPQSFGILNTGQGSMSWTASASTLSGGSGWLSLDQTSGMVARPYLDVSLVNMSIDPSGLAAGTYYGQIQVKAAGAANSPQSVSVELSVLPAGSNPGPELRPTGVIFIGTPGNSPGSQSVMVSNPSAASVDYGSSVAYVSSAGWLQYLPANARIAPGQPVKLILQPDYSNLQPGVLRGALTLVFSDGPPRTVSILNVVAPGANGSVGGAAEASSSCTTLLVHPTTLTDAAAVVTIGQATTLAVKVADNCGNLLTTGAVNATFSSGDPPVNLVHTGGGNWTGTWTPRNALQSGVTIQYRAFVGQGVSLASGSASVPAIVQTSAVAPLTTGVANAASFAGAYIAPGGLISIFGQQMATAAVSSSGVPFPTQVNGTQVLMGGVSLPLRYISDKQVNAQVPFNLGINSAQQLVVVRGATLSVPQDVVVAPAQPAVYTQDQSGKGAGVIFNGVTNQEITAANPAAAGDILVIYCNGLGAVNPPVPAGSPAPSTEPLARTLNPLSVSIGGVNAQVNFAGLAPGYPDLYQVNVVVPAGVPPGSSVPVVLSIAGQSSPPVTIAVR